MSFTMRTIMHSLGFVLAFSAASAAQADLVLSQLIVDLQPGKHAREDIELWNNSPERSFIAIDPREIVNPSLASQSARVEPDPEKLGLLVSPSRMILEARERRLLRIGTLLQDADHEHVYRVAVKPVAGAVQSTSSGLKIMVVYDVLVIVRPALAQANVSAVRAGRLLTFKNNGNVSVEIVDGRQCAVTHVQCVDLPAKRLYVGASWTVKLPSDASAEYVFKSPGRAERHTY